MSDVSTHRIAVFSGADLLGDALFKLPFVRALRATFPSTEIVWVTAGKTAYAGVLHELVASYLDRTIEDTGIGMSSAELLFPRATGLGPVDIAIDTQTVTWRSLAVRRALRPRHFVTAAAEYLLSGTRPHDIDRSWGRAKPVHFVDHLMRLLDLAARGAAVTDPTKIIVPPAFADTAAALLPEGPRYVGFAPGSGDTTKRWPLDRFIRLAVEASAQGHVPVFFVGPSERSMLDDIRSGVPGARFPEDEAPEGAPRGPLLVAALGRRLAAAIANDSGLGHMLAIAEIPLVLIYGRHSPEKYAPRTPQLHTVWAQDFGGPEHSRVPYAAVATALRTALDTSAR